MYWFDGAFTADSEKSLQVFELLGSLIGLALSNQYIIEVPLAPTCFKLLMGHEPSLDDLKQWQPETAKSLQYILDYDDEGTVALEDVICRNFIMDVSHVAEDGKRINTEVDLIENGSQTPVKLSNRQQYVSLFVNFEFRQQCKK